MGHSVSGYFLGSCAILLFSLRARGAVEDGNTAGSSEGAEGAPLAALPSSDPAFYEALPPPLTPHRRFKWGAEFRLEAAPIGGNSASNAAMAGFGMSLRPRPSPRFAVDIGADFFFGRDYNGERRAEQSLLVTPMIFLNPQSKLIAYLLGGVGLSSARVEHADGTLGRYSYLGANVGVGIEARAVRGITFDADILAFVRGRTDEGVNGYSEFVDPQTGRHTNTSAGMLLRIGAVHYW